MKREFIIACCVLCSVISSAESVEVTQIKPVQSSRHVRVSILLNGHPVSNVKVYFCANGGGEQLCSSVITGSDGVAAPPRLRDGDYVVSAVFEDELNAALYLHVSHKGKATSFSLDLTESFCEVQNAIVAANNLPIRARVQEFRGSLQDPTGAVIPGANIKIVRRGSQDRAVVQKLKSGADGRFSAHLEYGMYIAFFSSPGFRAEIVPFEVVARGEKEMLVRLQVGQSTQSMKVIAKQ